MSETESDTGAEPGTETSAEAGHDAFGLTAIETRPIERVLVRRRDSGVTTSAWRLDLTCDQGAGGIVRMELPGETDDQPVYRGDGVFLGWSQERLAEVYEDLSRPTDDGSRFELLQLG